MPGHPAPRNGGRERHARAGCGNGSPHEREPVRLFCPFLRRAGEMRHFHRLRPRRWASGERFPLLWALSPPFGDALQFLRKNGRGQRRSALFRRRAPDSAKAGSSGTAMPAFPASPPVSDNARRVNAPALSSVPLSLRRRLSRPGGAGRTGCPRFFPCRPKCGAKTCPGPPCADRGIFRPAQNLTA